MFLLNDHDVQLLSSYWIFQCFQQEYLNTQCNFLKTKESNLLEVQNNGEIEKVVDFMNEKINEKLCTFNS